MVVRASFSLAKAEPALWIRARHGRRKWRFSFDGSQVLLPPAFLAALRARLQFLPIARVKSSPLLRLLGIAS